MEPVPLPVHVYIVAPDCFRAEYFIKKNFFHIIFLLVNVFKAKLSSFLALLPIGLVG